MLTFSEWFYVAYEEKLQKDHVLLPKAEKEYLKYCKINHYTPLWDNN